MLSVITIDREVTFGRGLAVGLANQKAFRVFKLGKKAHEMVKEFPEVGG